MKTTLILAAVAIFVFEGSHGYAKSIDDLNNSKQPVSSVSSHNIKNVSAAEKVPMKPVTIKNIWNDMPSYDKYGNEITAKARKNMRENETLNKINQ